MLFRHEVFNKSKLVIINSDIKDAGVYQCYVDTGIDLATVLLAGEEIELYQAADRTWLIIAAIILPVLFATAVAIIIFVQYRNRSRRPQNHSEEKAMNGETISLKNVEAASVAELANQMAITGNDVHINVTNDVDSDPDSGPLGNSVDANTISNPCVPTIIPEDLPTAEPAESADGPASLGSVTNNMTTPLLETRPKSEEPPALIIKGRLEKAGESEDPPIPTIELAEETTRSSSPLRMTPEPLEAPTQEEEDVSLADGGETVPPIPQEEEVEETSPMNPEDENEQAAPTISGLLDEARRRREGRKPWTVARTRMKNFGSCFKRNRED